GRAGPGRADRRAAMSSRETDHGLHERALVSPATDPMDRTRFPVDEWALVESTYDGSDLGVTETLFAVGNGYLGLRGNVEEGRDTHTHGSFINGFHETWRIQIGRASCRKAGGTAG